MIDMWAITPVLIKNSVFIMHLIIAPKIDFFYFFCTHCTKLTKNHENKFASSIKMFVPNTYKTVCDKAINLQWKYTYLFILTLSLSSWNCPVVFSLTLERFEWNEYDVSICWLQILVTHWLSVKILLSIGFLEPWTLYSIWMKCFLQIAFHSFFKNTHHYV